MEINIIKFENISKEEWDTFVLTSNDAWCFHLYDWVSLRGEETLNYSFGVKGKEGGFIAIVPLFYEKIQVANILLRGFFSPGPALSPELGPSGRHSLLKKILASIDQLAEREKIDRLRIQYSSLAPSFSPVCAPRVNPLYFYGPFEPTGYSQLYKIPYFTKIIDLTKAEEVLWKDLKEACQRAIRKALKSNIIISEAKDISEVKDYYKIHCETYRRTGAKILPLSYYEEVWRRFHPKGYVKFYFANLKAEKIAGLITFNFKKGVTYWAGCSFSQFLHMRPNNLLQWHAIREAKRSGNSWYEVGPIFPYIESETKIYGIGRFKDQFGGDVYPIFEGVKHYDRKKAALVEYVRFSFYLKNKTSSPKT